MARILVLHGPNLNLLGAREHSIYGTTDLATINDSLIIQAQKLGHNLSNFQSNSESELIDHIHQAKTQADFIILNLAAYTHTSIALRDALLGIKLPFIETHISNVFAREPFRQHSYFADIAIGVIAGFGVYSYQLALLAAHHYLAN